MDLVKFGVNYDNLRFKKVVEAIIAEERAKQHNVLASQLKTIAEPQLIALFQMEPHLQINASAIFSMKSFHIGRLQSLYSPKKSYKFVQDLIKEQHRADLLRSYNLEPRNRLLFVGPPGNGKTSLAEAIAESLMIPLLVVRYESIVGTYLGETSVRLRKLFEYASTRRCVLFFDEFETLGKERGDTHETGEIKRVVSSLLLQIDSLPSHVVVIGATNHAELLDRAVWRRPIRINLPEPTRARLTEWFERFERRIKVPLGYLPAL